MDRRAEDRWKLYLQIISVFISIISVFFGFIMLCFVIGGGLLAFYLSSKTNDVSSNVTNVTLNQELIKVNATLQTIQSDIKKGSDLNIETKAKTEENTRNIEKLQQWKDAQEYKNSSVDRQIGKLEASREK